MGQNHVYRVNVVLAYLFDFPFSLTSSVDSSGGQVRFLRDRVVWCPVGCLGDGLDRDVNLAGRVPTV